MISGLASLMNAQSSSPSTSESQQALSNSQAASRDFAQFLADIQSGNVSAAQQDSAALASADSAAGVTLDKTDTQLAEDVSDGDITAAQAGLQASFLSSLQTNLDSMAAGNSGTQISDVTATDQGASANIRNADGTSFTMGVSAISPTMLATVQEQFDNAHNDGAAAEAAQAALQSNAAIAAMTQTPFFAGQ